MWQNFQVIGASLAEPLFSQGLELDGGSAAFGELRDSASLVGDANALQARMEEDGYLYVRNFFRRDLVVAARRSMLERLEARGVLDPDSPLEEGVLAPEANLRFLPELARDNAEVRRVIFGEEIHAFYRRLLATENVRHFDFVWVRAVGHGIGTAPHCDIVYMGRGTPNLYTAWIPYGDVQLELGGLMVLEGSHHQSDRIRRYLTSDVDTYCENDPSRHGWKYNGILSKNPVTLRQKFGCRWLTSEYRMGDLLTFRMDTVHASTDNHTRRVRLSTDTRYQRESEPVDERWIGDNPIAHGQAGKRGRIC